MGLVLKHVVRTKAGALHYRRRFPKDVSAVLHKGEFKRFLGSPERETGSAGFGRSAYGTFRRRCFRNPRCFRKMSKSRLPFAEAALISFLQR